MAYPAKQRTGRRHGKKYVKLLWEIPEKISCRRTNNRQGAPTERAQAATVATAKVTTARSCRTWVRNLENFKIKIRNTSKISKYKIHFDKAKMSKYPKISRFSKIFRNLVRRISAIFQVFTHFPHFFRIDFEKS